MKALPLALMATMSGCDTGVNVTSTSPPEARMAALDAAGQTVEKCTIRQYGELLDGLDGKCREDRAEIAGMVAKAVQLLARRMSG